MKHRKTSYRHIATVLCITVIIFLTQLQIIAATLDRNATTKKIRDVLGDPDQISMGPTFETWWYGSNYLHIHQHRLMGYSQAEALSIKLLPKKTYIDAAKWLHLESTEDDIINVLGTPQRLNKGNVFDIWWYGDDYIKLHRGHILEYTNAERLRFKFPEKRHPHLPKNPNEGSSKDDVIAFMGTPDKVIVGIEYDTWWYGRQFILIKNGRVHFIDKKPRNALGHRFKPYDDVNNNIIFKKLRYKGIDREPKKPIPWEFIPKDPSKNRLMDPAVGT